MHMSPRRIFNSSTHIMNEGKLIQIKENLSKKDAPRKSSLLCV